MNKLAELRAELVEIHDKMTAMLALVDEEKRDINDEEVAAYDALEKDYEGVEEEVRKEEVDMDRREKAAARKAELDKPVRELNIRNVPGKADNDEEFESFGEFIHSIRFKRDDPRLAAQYDTREQSMGVGEEGGFMVPNQFRDQILSLDVQDAIVRPRATIIPAGSPPDASITMPALNQSAAENMYGGVEFEWIGEGQAKPETDIKLKDVTWTPHEVAGHVVITDKLLRNWSAAGPFISEQFRKAKVALEDTTFLTSGTGVAQPLSVLNSPAAITIPRGTANLIVYQDLVNIEQAAREIGFSAYTYIGSPTIKSQLNTIVDPGSAGTLIWRRDAVSGAPSDLMGRDFNFNERSPGLGTAGDLMLVDMSMYIIKDGSGPFIASSEHVHFTKNKTVMKMFWNTDGHPWIEAPIPLEGDATSLVSPFVILGA